MPLITGNISRMHSCILWKRIQYWQIMKGLWYHPLNAIKTSSVTAGLDIDILLIHYTFTQVSQWGLTYIHTCQSYVHMPCADSSDFGLLEELSSQKYVIPCFVRRWTDQKNLTSLALSSSEKSITIQTNKQTVNDISTPHIAYRHVWMTNARQFNSHVPGKHGLSSFPLILTP